MDETPEKIEEKNPQRHINAICQRGNHADQVIYINDRCSTSTPSLVPPSLSRSHFSFPTTTPTSTPLHRRRSLSSLLGDRRSISISHSLGVLVLRRSISLEPRQSKDDQSSLLLRRCSTRWFPGDRDEIALDFTHLVLRRGDIHSGIETRTYSGLLQLVGRRGSSDGCERSSVVKTLPPSNFYLSRKVLFGREQRGNLEYGTGDYE
ncbi:hypothetical protein AKJ16_DCAP14400 [Drosera capensis]